MAETAITVQELTTTPAALTLYDANVDGNWYVPSGQRDFIHATNTNAAARVITVHQQSACALGDANDHDMSITVPATTGDVYFVVKNVTYFKDTSGYVHLTYDAVTNLKIAVGRLPAE